MYGDEEVEKVTELKIESKKVLKNSDKKNNIKKEELYHIVKSSETLFSISRIYDIDIEELRLWNHLSEQDILDIGQSILIKKPTKTDVSNKKSNLVKGYQTHTVKQEDTLYSIARQFDISIKEIMELNNKETFTIREGEELKIKAIN